MRPSIRNWLTVAALALAPAPGWAQSAEPPPPPVATAPQTQLLPTLKTTPAEPEEMHVSSLFYTPDEIKRVHFAISAYVKRTTGHGLDLAIDEINFLNQLNGSTSVVRRSAVTSRYYVYPQFFLESLVYHSPEDWVIWVNGQKITPDTPGGPDLRVISINPDEVVLEWRPEDMSKVNETWSQSPTDDAEVDKLHGSVRFALRPNQTFTSYSMRVLEGKVLPMQADTAAVPQNPIAAAVDKLAGQAPSDAKDKETGLTGLLDAYKNMQKGSTQ